MEMATPDKNFMIVRRGLLLQQERFHSRDTRGWRPLSIEFCWKRLGKSHNGSIAVRTTATRKTVTAKANATTRTRRCSNLLDALAKKSTVANNTVFARY